MSEYADAMLRMFHRNLDSAEGLDEPITTQPARARRIIALLVETLGGFAYGTAAGELVRAVATWFGAERAALVRAALPMTARPPAVNLDLGIRFGPERFSAEMMAALRARIDLAARDLAKLQDATIAVIPADNLRMSGAMFSELNRDSVFSDRLGIELRVGWVHACAAIERRRANPVDISPRAHNLWTTWSRLAGNPDPEPTRSPDHSSGYITRVG